tara:strand:+ start:14599 stop:15381 length:783 start_codon:yes stop_codon:yes gene_type:complete
MTNFGLINETFINIFSDAIVNESFKGKNLFKKYKKILKENKILNTQYKVYKSIEDRCEEDSTKVNIFVNESINLLKSVGSKTINEHNNILLKMIEDGGFKLIEEDYEEKELHENIGKLVSTRRSAKNIDVLTESTFYINNHVKTNTITEDTTTETKDYYNSKIFGQLLTDKFNEKYGDVSESDKVIFKSIINGTEDDRIELFKSSVNECIDAINTNLKECSIDEKDKLLQAKDKLLRSEYLKESYASEITKIANLKNTLI